MLVSAVILSFNSQRHVAKAVRSLAAEYARLAEPCEILVVDNGSTDGSVEILKTLEREHAGTLTVIYSPVNTGTTVSRNMALRRARGRVILIMDSDIEVPEGCLATLLPRLDADPRIGLLAPRLVYPDGRPQLSADVFPTLTHKLRRFLGLKQMERALPRGESATRRVDYAISAFWLIPRRVVERVGLLDERIFYSPEDVDYCLRVWEAGFEVVYDTAATAIHDAREISRGFKRPGFTFSHAKGLFYLFAKHRYVFGRARLYRRFGMTGKTT
jgi:GT2 family glycosyltransferase